MWPKSAGIVQNVPCSFYTCYVCCSRTPTCGRVLSSFVLTVTGASDVHPHGSHGCSGTRVLWHTYHSRLHGCFGTRTFRGWLVRVPKCKTEGSKILWSGGCRCSQHRLWLHQRPNGLCYGHGSARPMRPSPPKLDMQFSQCFPAGCQRGPSHRPHVKACKLLCHDRGPHKGGFGPDGARRLACVRYT